MKSLSRKMIAPLLLAASASCATGPRTVTTPSARCPAGASGTLCAAIFNDERQSTNAIRKFFRAPVRAEATGISWESRLLRPVRLDSRERLEEITTRLLDPQDPLNAEILAYQKDLAGKGQAAFWNVYFPMYDLILGYSDGYLEIFAQASRWLPTAGKIVDYGYGTANGAATLALLHPTRRIEGIDFSQAGRDRAVEKLRDVSQVSGASEARLHVGDLRTFALDSESVDGALMNNVLYAIPEGERVPLLRKILGELKPGSRFVLSDPHSSLQTDRLAPRALTDAVMNSSIANQSPMTEFDAAFFGFLNLRVLFGSSRFLSSTELEALAREAGFEVEFSGLSYYDRATFLVLRKPLRP